MKKLILFLCCLINCPFLFAQGLLINGNIVINDNSPEGAKITIAQNGKQIDVLSISKKGRFDLKLAIGADYKITFSKEGYVSKIVSVNTEVPEESIETNPDFPPIKLIINLLPYADGVNLSVFNQPIAILLYNQELDDFTFDKDYADKIKIRIAKTEQELKLAAHNNNAMEKERKFAALLGKGQHAFDHKAWKDAISSWEQALEIKPEQENVKQQIAAAQKELELETSRKATELQNQKAYQSLIAGADSLLRLKHYTEAREKYSEALTLKKQETYPQKQIQTIDSILADLAKQEAAETERKRIEEERTNGLREKYRVLINEADSAFQKENFALARIRYNEADRLNLGETYPKEQLREIDKIINSSQYKEKLAEYNKNKTLAEKSMQQKNYAGAKVYFQKALSILTIDQPDIERKIAEIDRLIEAARLAEIEKNYKENIEKADKAWREKAYAVARFYYKKCLEFKSDDRYASEQLRKVEELIGERQSKEAEL